MQSSNPYNATNNNLNINSEPKEKVHKSTLKKMDLLGNQASQQQNQLIDFDTIDAQACASVDKKISRFNPPLVGSLPNDFLRITPSMVESTSQQQSVMNKNQNLIRQQSNTSSNDHLINHEILLKKLEENERKRQSANADNKEIAQYLEDERIAISLMLQNQEFLDELRRNKEFMTALNYDAMNHNTRVKGFHNENYASSHAASSTSDTNGQNFSDADFKERLKKMGEVSRKKFAEFASLFSRRKGTGGLVVSRDALLGDQYAQLENDYSDSEEYGQKRQVNKN